MVADCGASKDTLLSAINGMLATTWTPMSESHPVPVAAMVAAAVHQDQRRRARIALVDVVQAQALRKVDAGGGTGGGQGHGRAFGGVGANLERQPRGGKLRRQRSPGVASHATCAGDRGRGAVECCPRRGCSLLRRSGAMTNAKLHAGGCHCGDGCATRPRPIQRRRSHATAPSAPSTACGSTFVKSADFKMVSGLESVATYAFNRHVIQHVFCRHCGLEFLPRQGQERQGHVCHQRALP